MAQQSGYSVYVFLITPNIYLSIPHLFPWLTVS